MIKPTLKMTLRNRLKVHKSKPYLEYMAKLKPNGFEVDHILESTMGLKLNDYLLDFKKVADHQNKHYGKGESEEEFEESLIRALNNLFSYIKHLEEKLNDIQNGKSTST